MPDIRLLEQEPIEFESLFKEYFPRVYNFIYYHVMNPDTADDLTAEVFCKAYKSFGRYDANRAQPYTWLCAIARNTVTDYKRRTAGIVLLDLAEQEEVAEASLTPEESYIEKEAAHTLLCLIHTLPQPHQDLITMKYFMQMTNREIAREMNLSESNVGTKLSRIIADLKKKCSA